MMKTMFGIIAGSAMLQARAIRFDFETPAGILNTAW
jgi:hypothetical protein